MNLYGYARVSTNGQALDAQITQLEAAGCGRIFREKVSGAKTERAELKKLLRALRNGDLVLVTRLDRLARSTRDLLNILARVNNRSAGFRSLGDAWADTTTAHGRLMLTVLGGLAEFERELIRTRTAEGRARAVAMGVRLGRRPKLNHEQRRQACERKRAGEAVASIAKAFNVSDSTILRINAAVVTDTAGHSSSTPDGGDGAM
ncbi:recombinase family protein [uncultured Bradyrhizobium sp.]|uniref:recombinase family protein n=1 Tax=uncultured Bradyrhizobium sp. TaxID=199684 RepID=UPI0035CA4118